MKQYRFRNKGYGKTEWLTKRQIDVAAALDVKWYPTKHGDMVCPTPEVCGWYCSDDDEQKIKRVIATMAEKAR